jgi:tetratricopeptide (TPR) repeat protein
MKSAFRGETSRREFFWSPFRTTIRNEIFDWLAKIIIYPAYFVCILGLGDWIAGTRWNIISPLFIVIAIVSLLPPLLIWSSWPLGFRGREHSYFASIAILLGFYYQQPERTFSIFWVIFFIMCMVFMLRRIWIRKEYHPPDVLAILWTILLSIFVYFAWRYLAGNNWQFGPIRFIPLRWQFAVFASIAVFISIWLLLEFTSWFSQNRRGEIFHRTSVSRIFLRKNLFWGIIFLLLYLALRFAFFAPLSSMISLAILLLAADPYKLLSRSQARLRDLVKPIRVNSISNLLSRDFTSIGWLYSILARLRAYVKRNSQLLSYIFILLLSGVGLPLLAYLREREITFVSLIQIGLMSGFVLSTIFLIYWIIRNRPKNIVLPFTVAEGQREAQLQSMADLMTYAFVEQLREISLLLSIRQVENIASRSDHTLPVFVTSGTGQEWIEQVQSLGNIEVGKTSFPLGGFLESFLKLLAHTRVKGTIVRQKDNSIAVLVEYSQRGGQVVSVDLAFVPETSAADLDEKVINNIAKTLATKLLVKLGEHVDLASTWRSLLDFITGLDAAYHRNWWHAIESYRKTLQYEESIGGFSGPSYYHLGATLILQGEVKEGYRMLSIAEARGTPQAETQYMMALALYYIHRDSLHFRPVIFHEIVERCQEALRLRSNFPEAHQLLGNTYYQRGRLLDKGFILKNKSTFQFGAQIQDFISDYKQAAHHLKLAIRGYDKAIRSLPRDPVAQSTIFNERANLTEYRMAATHRLADALRGLGYFMEAITYYQDVLTVFPGSTKTLVDMAKSYCYSHNWQQAYAFIRKKIFSGERHRWHKSACFYMGWTILGGVLDQLALSSRIMNFFINLYLRISQSPGRTPNLDDEAELLLKEKSSKDNKKVLLSKAVVYLDYYIQQFPRYTRPWRRTFWYNDFREVIRKLSGVKNFDDRYRQRCYNASFDIQKDDYLDQLLMWIAWRVVLINPVADEALTPFTREIIGWPDPTDTQVPVPETKFTSLFSNLLQFRKRMVTLLLEADRLRTLGSFEQHYDRLMLASDMVAEWQIAAKALVDYLPMGTKKEVSFAERWVIDIFAELSMLSARVLAECDAFEALEYLARKSAGLLERWVERWKDVMPKGFHVSNKLLGYEIATLYSWLGYAELHKSVDPTTVARRKAMERSAQSTNSLSEAEHAVEKANRFMPNHPLAIFVNALVLQRNGQGERASDELNRLMSNIWPTDPHKYELRTEIAEKINEISSQDRQTWDNDVDMILYYKERVSGRLQFDSILGRSRLHRILADIAEKAEDFDAAAGHGFFALASAPYKDVKGDILLSIAELLTRQENFIGALSLVQEAKNRFNELSSPGLKDVRTLQLLVMECKLHTSIERYSESLELSNGIPKIWNATDLVSKYKHSIDALSYQPHNRELPRFLNRHRRLFNDKIEQIVSKENLAKANARSLIGIIDLIRKKPISELLKSFNKQRPKPSLHANEENEIHIDEVFDLSSLLGSQLINGFYMDLVTFIIQEIETISNKVRNYAQLGHDLTNAKESANLAIQVMKKVSHLEESFVPGNWRAKLAQLYDTLAWVCFVQGSSSALAEAHKILSEESLKFDQKSAVIYYHLARVRLAQLEHVWQGLSAENRNNVDIDSNTAWMISQYFRDAFMYWRHSHRLDKARSLYSRLRIVRTRIDIYRRNWEKLLIPLAFKEIAGPENTGSPDRK